MANGHTESPRLGPQGTALLGRIAERGGSGLPCQGITPFLLCRLVQLGYAHMIDGDPPRLVATRGGVARWQAEKRASVQLEEERERRETIRRRVQAMTPSPHGVVPISDTPRTAAPRRWPVIVPVVVVAALGLGWALTRFEALPSFAWQTLQRNPLERPAVPAAAPNAGGNSIVVHGSVAAAEHPSAAVAATDAQASSSKPSTGAGALQQPPAKGVRPGAAAQTATADVAPQAASAAAPQPTGLGGGSTGNQNPALIPLQPEHRVQPGGRGGLRQPVTADRLNQLSLDAARAGGRFIPPRTVQRRSPSEPGAPTARPANSVSTSAARTSETAGAGAWATP